MHLLAVDEEVVIDRVIVVLPQCIGVVADITSGQSASVSGDDSPRANKNQGSSLHLLDSHQTNTRQDPHDREELPELDVAQQLPAPYIYTMGPIHINTALH